MNEEVRHFSLRKLSVGLASVLVGVSIFGASQTVKADTVANSPTSSLTNNAQSDSTQENGNATKSTFSDNEQGNSVKNNAAQNQEETKNDQKQDQIKKGQQPSANSQEVNDISNLDAGKNAVRTGSLPKANNQSNNQPEGNSQAQPQNSPKLAKKVLTTNLIATPPTTNGGFDEATWGKLDVNNWQGQAENGVYELTGYTGDSNHVIVPNAADFEQAGKSTNGLQVGITSDIVMSLSYGAKLGQRTIAFSKTSSQKVKAIGPDWSNAFAHTHLSRFDGSNLDVSSVTNMRDMFNNADFSDLTSLADWDTSNVTDMTSMFGNRFYMSGSNSTKNLISDLTPLKNWDTGKVISMSEMFAGNSDVIDLKPIANWNISSVKSSFNLFAGDSKLNLININNTPLMQGFLKMPYALQGSTFITNNVDLAKAVVGKEAQALPISTSTATRTITFYIPHVAPEQTIQHIYYKTIAPVQIDYPIRSIGGGGFSSGTGSSVVVGGNGSSSGGFHYTLGGGGFSSGAGSSVVVGGYGSSSGTSSSSGGGFDYELGGGGFSSGTGSSTVVGGSGSSSGNSSSSGEGSSSGSGSSSGTGSSVIIRNRMRMAFANAGAPIQTGSDGPKIVKTYPLTDVKKSDWQLDDSKQNDAIVVNGQVRFKAVKIPHINGYKAHLVPNKINPAMLMVSFIAIPTKNKPSLPNEEKPSKPIEETPSKPSAPVNNANKFANDLQKRVITELNSNDSGWTMPNTQPATYTVEMPADNTIDLSDLVIAEPVHAQTRMQIHVTKRFKLRKHGKKHVVKRLKHRKKTVRQFKKYRL